jgi:outer membrane protein OmpA-like peptidoglycan-associated protein
MILAAGLTLAVPAVAHAEWYVSADGGVSWLQDTDVSFPGASYTAENNIGPVVLGAVGYSFGAVKVEGELGFRYNDVDKLKNQSNSSGDSTDAYSLMTNAIYDFNATGAWHPFVGLGVGAAYLDFDKVSRNGAKVYSGNSWEFAYQGFAGVSYDLDENWSVKGQYRYFATTDGEVKTAAGVKGDAEYADHSVMIGLTYRFGAPKASKVAAAAPAPAPAVAPVAAPVAQKYMVFFDFDKATLTPEGQAVVAKAAAAFKSGKEPRIDLTGHADRAGSDAYNMKLSQRRADAVKAALVRQGVPAAQIAVAAKGESSPLVSTADGVREPQNRRVEIVLP